MTDGDGGTTFVEPQSECWIDGDIETWGGIKGDGGSAFIEGWGGGRCVSTETI